MIRTLTPAPWPDYELIDTGDFEKLERFGPHVVARPEPQAVWDKALPPREWERLAQAVFSREAGPDRQTERGRWSLAPSMPERWMMRYARPNWQATFKVALSAFKHVGVFPEQAANWDYIYQQCQPLVAPKVLNLFAYTGVASLAARAAGAQVTHVDAVKPVITWARENMEASHQTDIRWVVEDVLKFVEREARRGNRYQGLILDPPAYGRGPNGEKWVLEDHLNALLKVCAQLLAPPPHFFVLNLYSLGFSALIVENLLQTIFKPAGLDCGELYLTDRAGRKLPLGVYGRFGG